MRTLAALGALLLIAPLQAATTEWLEGTVLADCEYCKTDNFDAERRKLANQSGQKHDPASGMGYVVTMERDGPFVWGRAALVGTGNLIRTDAHVLFTDAGRFKAPDGKMYFEPMQHGGETNLIEIDLSSVQRGGAVGPLETDIKNDWAVARLKEDAIEKFGGERVFAFLWDFRVTHDEISKQGYRRASALVLSREHQYEIDETCESVADDHPSRYVFGVEEVFFIRCPSEHLQVGSSGSGLAIWSADTAWSLGGQIVAGAASGPGPRSAYAQQLLLGNVPMFKQTITIVYLQELVRRGMDPRDR